MNLIATLETSVIYEMDSTQKKKLSTVIQLQSVPIWTNLKPLEYFAITE